MSIVNLTASAYPLGNRIDLSWEFLPDSVYDGVRILRKAGSFPEHYDDGVFVADISKPTGLAIDQDLASDQYFYYTLFPYSGSPAVYDLENRFHVNAYVTSNHGHSELLYQQLPSIYRRYDAGIESLNSYLSVIGSQLDQFYSYSHSLQQIKAIETAPSQLLPLLGDWIGWKTDFKRQVDQQRLEIKNAPAIYQRTQLLPTVEATVKRISGWESRTKEYLHNIFTSNRPGKLNLWQLIRDVDGTWREEPELQSLDANHEGSSSFTIDSNNNRWLVYHTQRKNTWQIWAKQAPKEPLPLALESELNAGLLSELLSDAIKQTSFNLSQLATLNQLSANLWEIVDGVEHYLIEVGLSAVWIIHDSSPLAEFSGSEPLMLNENYLFKYPTVVSQNSETWLFASRFSEANDFWSIRYQIYNDARWGQQGPSEPDASIDIALNPFAEAGVYDASRQRKYPFAVIDDSQRIWLFWLEMLAGRWQLRYNRRDGLVWGQPVTMPLDAGDDPRVVKDIQVLIRPDPTPLIYVFWSRPATTSLPGQVRWEVAYRVKEDFNLDSGNWTGVQNLPKDLVSDDHDDCEPWAIVIDDQVEVFFSSNRDLFGWSLWQNRLNDYTTNNWNGEMILYQDSYAQRNPMPVIDGEQVILFHRNNRHVQYTSEVYQASESNDLRYSGGLSLDQREFLKHQYIGGFFDHVCYSYDTGKNNKRSDNNKIARDTLGLFLETDTYDSAKIQAGIERLRPVIDEFIPLTDRSVFVTESDVHLEHVYTYDLPPSGDSYYILSEYQDVFNGDFIETVLSDGEDFANNLE